MLDDPSFITEIKALSTLPIYVGNIPIYPVSIFEMTKFGIKEYLSAVNLLCTPGGLEEKTDIELKDEQAFLLLYTRLLSANGLMLFLPMMLKALELIFGSRVYLCPSRTSFILEPQENENDNLFTNEPVLYFDGEGVKTGSVKIFNKNIKNREINALNYSDIVKIIKLRNYIKADEDDENEDDDPAVREYKRKRKKYEKIINKQKGADKENKIELSDIISVMAQLRHISPNEIMKQFDMYGLMDQFAREQIMDEYKIGAEALIHGADPKEIKLKHWLTKSESQ